MLSKQSHACALQRRRHGFRSCAPPSCSKPQQRTAAPPAAHATSGRRCCGRCGGVNGGGSTGSCWRCSPLGRGTALLRGSPATRLQGGRQHVCPAAGEGGRPLPRVCRLPPRHAPRAFGRPPVLHVRACTAPPELWRRLPALKPMQPRCMHSAVCRTQAQRPQARLLRRQALHCCRRSENWRPFSVRRCSEPAADSLARLCELLAC
jgi:hypothetical protein